MAVNVEGATGIWVPLHVLQGAGQHPYDGINLATNVSGGKVEKLVQQGVPKGAIAGASHTCIHLSCGMPKCHPTWLH